MKVLIINQCFYPDHAATAQHAWDLARRLKVEGHTVTAIASRSAYGGRGSTFPSYEIVDGVAIERVATNRFGKAGLLGRGVDFVAFHLLAGWRAARLQRQDTVICLTTPPFAVLIGLLLKALYGTKIIYWVMDLYPDVAVSFGALRAKSFAARALERFHRWSMRYCDAIVVLGRCMRHRLLAKGIAESALHVINPWSNPEELTYPREARNRFRSQWAPGANVLIMYSGNFGLGHDFETLAEAFAALPPLPQLRIALVGDGKRKAEVLKEMFRVCPCSEISEAPHQPRELLGELLSAADIHLVTLKHEFEGLMVPSKFYGAIGAGKPVVFVGPRASEIALAILESGAGAVVAPGDAAELRRVIVEMVSDPNLRHDMSTRALHAATHSWSSEIALDRWQKLVEQVGTAKRTTRDKLDRHGTGNG